MAAPKIDTHQHFWNLERVEYSWLGPQYGPLYRTYEPPELEPQLRAAGIDRTVLVQSANSYADTDHMLEQADTYDWIGAVIGWVPLLEPEEAGIALDRYARHPKFRGMRHLIHEEPDPDWVVQAQVIEGLKQLEARDMIFEVVAVFPDHLKHVPTLAERLPGLRLVIDHLAKPPIKAGEMEPWTTQIAAAARYPNVYAKISGLNTAADWETWSGDDLRPYIDFAIEQFGVHRLMFGSDWPVCVLAGDYAKVWAETNRALARRPQPEVDALLGGTAARVYGICQRQSIRRFGQVIGVKSEGIAEYERLHRAVWPEVLAMIHGCNIRNYSIFRHGNTLFAYFEYVGEDYQADMAKMAADPKTQEWWSVCMPLQEPLPDRSPGEWWTTMDEVFHCD